MSLLHEIVRCPNIKQCLSNNQSSHPCSRIISVQSSKQLYMLKQHQMPEPWSGDIEHAPILFVSSNPSISESRLVEEQEEFPLWSWSDDHVEDFFTHRYKGGRKQWIKDGTYSLQQNGLYSQKPVDFWSDIRILAKELLGKKDIDDGVDYALTEVVHCKSKKEEGVKEALRECVELYLRRVIELSGAKVIAVLGSKAEEVVRNEFGISKENVVGPKLIGKRQRYVVFLYHPSYCRRPDHKHYKPCTFGEGLNKEMFQEIRAFISMK